MKDDLFGKQLLGGGMPEAMIKDWSVDPQVVIVAELSQQFKFSQREEESGQCLTKDLVENNSKSLVRSGVGAMVKKKGHVRKLQSIHSHNNLENCVVPKE